MKSIIPVLAIAIGLSLTGCTEVEPVPAQTVTVTVTATPTPTPTPSKVQGLTDTQFLDLVRAKHPLLRSVEDDMLLRLVDSSCRAFDRGATREQVLGAISIGDDPRMVEAIAFAVGAGIQNYCPQYS